MILVRCAKGLIDSILIVVFLKKDVHALQWNLMYSFFSNLKMRKLFVHMIKYQKALGIDSLNLYAQQWNLIFLFSHLFENEKIVCLYFKISEIPSLQPILFLYRHI
jgi:hypothetical protein